MKINKIRDLVLVDIDENKSMVIACDSCGSIGDKPHDALKVPPFITGKYTVRVGLLEVLSSGAEVVTVIDNVCAEMKPTGEEIIKGIKSELELANINSVALNGSTEENFPCVSTGLGITIIGISEKSKLRVNNIKDDILIYSIGIPKVGEEISYEYDEDIFQYDVLYYLRELKEVKEIVPVGSKGILYEAEELAKNNCMEFILEENLSIDINRSCGPATVAIIAVDKNIEEKIKAIKNSHKIGIIKK